MSSIQIRRARRKTDIEKVIKLARSMWLHHADKEPNFLRRDYLENYDIQDYFQECFDKPKKNVLFVADSNGEIVGIVRVEIVKIDGMFTHQHAAYIDDLVVDENYRRQRIANNLLEVAEDFAKEKGIHIMKTRIYGFNKSTIELFKKRKYYSLYSEHYKIIKD